MLPHAQRACRTPSACIIAQGALPKTWPAVALLSLPQHPQAQRQAAQHLMSLREPSPATHCLACAMQGDGMQLPSPLCQAARSPHRLPCAAPTC